MIPALASLSIRYRALCLIIVSTCHPSICDNISPLTSVQHLGDLPQLLIDRFLAIHLQAPQASPNRNGQRSTWSFKDEVARSRRKTGGDSVTPPLYEAIDAEILFRSWDEAKEAASPPRPPPPATWAPHEESGTVDSEELSPGAAMSENPDAEALDRSADEPECSHGAQKSSSSSGGRLVKVRKRGCSSRRHS